MIVVADTSPFIGFLRIGQIELLPRLFEEVLIPPQIVNEMASPRRPSVVQEFIKSKPSGLLIRSPAKMESISGIDEGEVAAISLARELNADVLLIDDRLGREAAMARNIRTARTAAVLFDAANAGLLPDLKDAFDKLRATNFRVPAKILDELLERHKKIMGE